MPKTITTHPLETKELLDLIFSLLDLKNLANAAQVSKFWKETAKTRFKNLDVLKEIQSGKGAAKFFITHEHKIDQSKITGSLLVDICNIYPDLGMLVLKKETLLQKALPFIKHPLLIKISKANGVNLDNALFIVNNFELMKKLFINDFVGEFFKSTRAGEFIHLNKTKLAFAILKHKNTPNEEDSNYLRISLNSDIIVMLADNKPSVATFILNDYYFSRNMLNTAEKLQLTAISNNKELQEKEALELTESMAEISVPTLTP